MIIDSHVHIFPDALAGKAVARLQSGADMPLASDGTLSGLLRSMEAGRIARSLTLPVCTRPDQVRSINRFAVELSRRPEIISFGALHPGCGDLRGEIAFLADAGIRGVKLHPD